MASSTRLERSLLAHEEVSLVALTHFPAIFDASDKELADVRKRIRDLGEKERTIVRQLRRTIRGKADQRGSSFPGNVARPSERKQVFASAVRRVNRELSRRRAMEAREALKRNAQNALRLKSSSNSKSPPASRAADEGMTPLENRKRQWGVRRAQVGSVLKAGARAQAKKDLRPTPV